MQDDKSAEPPTPPELTAADYGASAEDLETLRRIVEQRCPSARFGGFTATGARNGEYRFALPPTGRSYSRSIYVRAPLTPKGKPRDGLGLWNYRLARNANGSWQPWQRSATMEAVVGWIGRQTGWPHLSRN